MVVADRTEVSDGRERDGSQPDLDGRRSEWTMRTVQWIGMHVSRSIALPIAEAALSRVVWRVESQRTVVARNLARVLGHPADAPIVQRATRDCFRLYGRYWYETFALRTMPAEEVERRMHMEGAEHIDRALEVGKGIICALPHMGNWDAAGHWLCLRGYRMTAVAEELKPPGVFELFLRHRRALGMNIVPLGPGANVGPTLMGLLGTNHVVTLVADRELSGRGVEVEMFGAPRRMPAGPAYLSLATGTPLSVCAVFTTDDGWRTKIGPPVQIERSGHMRTDVTALTRVIAAGFERYISEAPTDWHMFQPAWPEEDRVPAGGSTLPDPG